MYSNHAVNFFLYCAAGERFRRQLCRLACPGREDSGATVARRRTHIELTAANDRPTMSDFTF